MPILYDRYNAYKIMWIFVLFDLLTQTKKERKIHSDFRKKLVKDGFVMFQFSMYIRHCPSIENAKVHIQRVKKSLPAMGHIAIFSLTDKQFGDMEIFYGKKLSPKPDIGQQLELF